jgi:hypothetical protein
MSNPPHAVKLVRYPRRERERFLQALFLDPDSVIDVRALKPDGAMRRVPCSGIEDALREIGRGVAEDANVYVGVARRETLSRSVTSLYVRMIDSRSGSPVCLVNDAVVINWSRANGSLGSPDRTECDRLR